MRDGLRVVAALPQSLRERGEGRRSALGQSVCRVSPGRRRSGSESAHFNLLRTAASGEIVQPELVDPADAVGPVGVWMRNRSMSETISSGGFSKRQRVLP